MTGLTTLPISDLIPSMGLKKNTLDSIKKLQQDLGRDFNFYHNLSTRCFVPPITVLAEEIQKLKPANIGEGQSLKYDLEIGFLTFEVASKIHEMQQKLTK